MRRQGKSGSQEPLFSRHAGSVPAIHVFLNALTLLKKPGSAATIEDRPR